MERARPLLAWSALSLGWQNIQWTSGCVYYFYVLQINYFKLINITGQIREVDGEMICDDDAVFSNAALLVMPGGADLPYCSRLNGRGVARIRGFVESGGSYIGLCAGAYFGASRCSFAQGDPTLAVVGERECSFFPGSATGPVHSGFAYGSESGAIVCRIILRGGACDGEESFAYCNGGPCFLAFESGDGGGIGVERPFSVVAAYAETGQPAAVCCNVGKGRAVLVGPHPEFAARHFSGAQQSDDAHRISNVLSKVEPLRKRFWQHCLDAALD